MNRYFLPPSDWAEGGLCLTGDEAKHCAQVMREPVGGRIEIFDGAGRFAVCEILSAARSNVQLRLLEENVSFPPKRRVTLVQAIPKGKNMDWIVQKAVELGVNRIIPILSQHCVFKVSSASDAGRKRDKWQRTALEACKQCGQNWLVEIEEPQDLSDVLGRQEWSGIVGSLQEGVSPIAEVLQTTDTSDDRPVAVAIGPEGDFSAEEYKSLMDNGFTPVSLGKLILRTETAAFAILAILMIV